MVIIALYAYKIRNKLKNKKFCSNSNDLKKLFGVNFILQISVSDFQKYNNENKIE